MASGTNQDGHASSQDDHSPSPNSQAPQRRRSSFLSKTSSPLWRLLDPAEPWILTDEGSFLGYFDFVPREFRVGPWSAVALVYLTVLFYVAALACAYWCSEASHPWWKLTQNFATDVAYPPLYSIQWYYHVSAAVWMFYVMVLVATGPLSYKAWSTYTIQSWTTLWVRHVLSALAPHYSWALVGAEYLRFPVACSTTCTFGVWNVVLFPYTYWIALRGKPDKQQKFWEFNFSFRLVQIHVFNLAFLILNVYWASPQRPLEVMDFALALFSSIVYMAWYLMVLDRLGIHLYPVFSPRVWWLVIPMWTLLLTLYAATFGLWRWLLWPSE